jgi:hypothetical protein
MDLIPESFLREPEIERLLRQVFEALKFALDSFKRTYEVQLSAIRFAPEHGRTATSPPPYPHRDGVDGAVVVLNRQNVMGGISRLFDNDGRALYEFELGEGQGFLIKDDRLLHYVSDVQLRRNVDRGYRDILIVRFSPIGR